MGGRKGKGNEGKGRGGDILLLVVLELSDHVDGVVLSFLLQWNGDLMVVRINEDKIVGRCRWFYSAGLITKAADAESTYRLSD